MKNKNVMIYSLGLLLCAAVCSCQDDPTADDGGDNWTGGGEVKFSLSTRAGDSEVTTTFADGTSIGIVPSGGTSKNYCYRYDEGNVFSAVTDKIFWEGKVTQISVDAFYPYNASGYSTLSVQIDQSGVNAQGQSNYYLSDALHAKASTTRTDNDLRLTFHHVMSKLVLNVSFSDGQETITAIKIGNNDQPLSASFTYKEDGGVNTVTPTESGSKTIIACPNGDNIKWRAIIVPQTSALRITVSTNSGTYATTLPNTSYSSGQQYTCSFKVLKDKLTIEQIDIIADWESGGSITAN